MAASTTGTGLRGNGRGRLALADVRLLRLAAGLLAQQVA